MIGKNPNVKVPNRERRKEGWCTKLMLNMKCDLGENRAIHIYYAKCFPLQMLFSSAVLSISKAGDASQQGSLWDFEVQKHRVTVHQSDLALLTLDWRKRKTEEMDLKCPKSKGLGQYRKLAELIRGLTWKELITVRRKHLIVISTPRDNESNI